MSIEIIPICYDCNEELSSWDRFLNKKYPNTLGYTLCSQCEKRREEKIRKELAQSIADDLDIYDFEQDVTRGGKLK
tara:strand:- start:15 stop:242 length:228 start_codon:yes stop_codon:yes gene_type:complete